MVSLKNILRFLVFTWWSSGFMALASAPSTLTSWCVEFITGSYKGRGPDIQVNGPLPFTIRASFDPKSPPSKGSFCQGWKFEIESIASSSKVSVGQLHLVEEVDELNRFKSISVMDPLKSTSFSWAEWTYTNDSCTITTHTGDHWTFRWNALGNLTEIVLPNQQQMYFVTEEDPHSQLPRITKQTNPQGEILHNEYYQLGSQQVSDKIIHIDNPLDFRIGRIRAQYFQAQEENLKQHLASFVYEKGKTVVENSVFHPTHYLYEEGHLKKIKTFEEDKTTLYRVDSFFKERLSPSTESHIHLVSNAAGVEICEVEEYDSSNHLVKETLYGNLSGSSQGPLMLDEHNVPVNGSCESYSIQYTYNADGSLCEQVEDNGKRIRFFYDPSSHLLICKCIFDHADLLIRYGYTYDFNGFLTCISIDDGKSCNPENLDGVTERHLSHILYSPSGLPAEMKKTYLDLTSHEEIPIQTQNIAYTEQEVSLIKQRPNQRPIECRQSFNLQGQPTVIEYVNKNKTEFFYDVHNRPTKKILSSNLEGGESYVCPPLVYEFDTFNRISASIDAKGYCTTYMYNARGKPIKIGYSDGTEESWTYHLDGRLCTATAKNGAITYFNVDLLGRTTRSSIHAKSGKILNTLESSYNSFHQLSQTDSKGVTTFFAYNNAGELNRISKIDEFGFSEFLIPAASSSLPCIPEPPEEKENLVFPASSLFRIQASSPLFSPKAEGESLEDVGTNKNAEPDTEFDGWGRPICMVYKNAAGLPFKEVRLKYDDAGNRIEEKISSPNASVPLICTQWEWGPLNRLEKRIECAHTDTPRETCYLYNELGELSILIKADGTKLFYTYNEEGLLKDFYSSDGSFSYTYSYDTEAHVNGVEDHVLKTTTTRVYNPNQKILSERQGTGLCIQNVYNREGLRTDFVLPDLSKIEYGYEEERLSSIKRVTKTGEEAYVHRYHYDQQHHLIESDLIKSLGRLSFKSSLNSLVVSSPYGSYELKQNPATFPKRIQQMSFSDGLGKENRSYCYDQFGFLSLESSKQSLTSQSYIYDVVGNRTQKNAYLETVNDHQELVSNANVSYEYDSNGNSIHKVSGDITIFFKYDALDRLIEVFSPKSYKIIYSYDAFHRRLKKSSYLWSFSSADWILENDLRFVYDGDLEIGALNTAGEWVDLRILGLSRTADIGGAVALELQGKLYAPLHDHQGSIIALINTETQEVEEYVRYTAFGEEQIFNADGCQLAASACGNPWRFSSKRKEDETGLIHFGQRDYAPEIARWITPDPVGLSEGSAPYTYVKNQPLNHTDPYGMYALDLNWNDFYKGALNFYETTQNWYNTLKHQSQLYLQDEDFTPILNSLEQRFEEAGNFLLGSTFFYLSGYYVHPSISGVYGNEEKFNNLRVTFINGILNDPTEMNLILKNVSASHGNTNVHYIYRGTQGWTLDMVHCVWVKMGLQSTNSKQLATTWKKLIKDMKEATEEGGTIIHYAHSVGGTETLNAKSLLTPQELARIRVVTFGSATVIPNGGFRDVINYSSRRDGVSSLVTFLPNPLYHSYFLKFGDYSLVTIGAHSEGFPLVDHFFEMYWNYWLNHAHEDRAGIF